MYKTIGFIAGALTLQKICVDNNTLLRDERRYSGENMNEGFDGEELVKEYETVYNEFFDRLNFAGIDINVISSSRSGAKKIVTTIFAQSPGIDTIQK